MRFAFDRSLLHDLDRASRLEWLEANGTGGWASSTVSGMHTRRYHGLLVAATAPPLGRTVLLSRLDETIVRGGARHDLGVNRFPGAVHPEGHLLLRSFEKEWFPVATYESYGVVLRRTIAAIHGESTTAILYEVLEAPAPFHLELRPFGAWRDFHRTTRQNGFADLSATFENGTLRARPYPETPGIFLAVPGATFLHHPDWWRAFEYDRERERGLEFAEDLFTWGSFSIQLRKGDRLGVLASTEETAGRDAFELVEKEKKRRQALVRGIAENDPRRALALAADAFLVRRGEAGTTILAGYPWFSDWGRDAMIALPGIALATGRHDEAFAVLRTFAGAASEGRLPNRFPEEGTPPVFDTADASLWFFVAVHAFLEATGDLDRARSFLPLLREIVVHHGEGTRHGIRVEDDGLLRAGEPGLALTWMDAKVGELAVTPRVGKPVEVNALWVNALSILADLEKRAGYGKEARETAARAKRAKERFQEVFWNEKEGTLFDVVDGDRRDPSIRPNALLALSLPYSLLPKDRARRVLDVVEERLLTPVGLRSLASDHPEYRPRYEGGPAERDAAYHQGTVWSWLLGPYATACVKVMGAAGKPRARRALEAILPHLREAGIGQISEIFDAEPPHAPRGAIAQAWSVGEILRALRFVGSTSAAKSPTGPSSTKRRYKIVGGKPREAIRAKGRDGG